MSTPAERTGHYTVRDLRLRQLDYLAAVLERDPDDWQTIERFAIQGQLLRAWDWALQEHDYAVRFTLAVRRYCAMRNLERDYLERGRQISDQARRQALPEDDVRLLLSLGQVAETVRQPDLAMWYFQQVLTHPFQEDADYKAFALNNIGQVYASREDWPAAIDFYEQALAVWREDSDDHEGLAVTLLNLGHSLARLGEASKGIGHLQEALAVIHDQDRPEVEAMILDRLGWAYEEVGRPADAINAYERAVPLRRLVGDRDGESSTLSSLALVHQHLGEYQRALSLLQEALRIQEALPDQDLSSILNNLATVWLNLGDTATSLNYLERVLEMEQEYGYLIGEATTLNNMGLAHAESGDFLSARDHYRRALKLWHLRRHKRGLAHTLQNLALTEIRLNDLPTAMKHLLRAERIQRSIEDVPGLGITLNNIGLALSETSNPMRALPYYVEAQSHHARTSQRSEQITTLVNHARLHWRLSNPDDARTLLMQAIELDHEVGNSQIQEHLDLLERWSSASSRRGGHNSEAI